MSAWLCSNGTCACSFGKLIDDPSELEWFVTNVITPEWHYDHDKGGC
jgi:hypothetical protein